MIQRDRDATDAAGATGVTDQSAQPMTVLFVDDEPEYLEFLETAFDRRPHIDVRLESDPRDAVDRLDGVDCVVSDYDMPHLDGLDLLEAVRDRAPELPFVLHTGVSLDEVGDGLFESEQTDYVPKGGGASLADLLSRRITLLVGRARLHRRASRFRAALDACRDPVLIVDGDGAVAYANRRLAAVLSADPDAVRGRPWAELFADDAVDRLRDEAIPVGSEGWNWTGRTVLSTREGEELRAQTDLTNLEDGSVVFSFHDLEGVPED